MSDVLRLHGLGAAVDVHVEGVAAEELTAAMRGPWARCLLPPFGGAVAVEAEPLHVRLDDEAQLTTRLMLTTREVTRALIAARAGQLVMFHAGAVSDPRSGASVVLVAKGGTGKTTLCRLLGQRLGYLTDETVAIDAQGLILPYPKPLSVRRAAEPRVKDELSPDVLGLLPAPPSPRVSRLVLLERQPEHRTSRVEELGFMDAVFGLAEQSSSLHLLPQPLARLADVIDDMGPVLRITYSESADAARHALGLLEVAG